MNGLLVFFISTLGIGLLFSVLALAIEKLLIANGIAKGNSGWLIVITIFLVFFKQLAYPDTSFWFLGPFVVFCSPLIVNRSVIRDTLRKGRWWWKSEDYKKVH